MPETVIVSTARSPIGRAFRGSLADVRPDDLGALIVRALLDKVDRFDLAMVDDVICGAALQAGEQSMNVGRLIGALAGLPPTVPGTTVNRFCASSLQAIRMAHHAIAAGEGDVFVAMGVESVSRVNGKGFGEEDKNVRFTDPSLPDYVSDMYVAMGLTAENVAERWNVSRADMDAFALRSHRRAIAAQESGFFERELTPVRRADGSVMSQDEGPRSGTSIEALAALEPSFVENGRVTAGNSCPLNDGAAAVLLMSETRARTLGLKPLARIVGSSVTGVEPEIMGMGPVEATRRVLASAGMTMRDVDVVELNEAFAAQVLAVCAELDVDIDEQLNPHGGAIALGHPFGMTGARIMSTLINDLETLDKEVGSRDDVYRRRSGYGDVDRAVGVAGMWDFSTDPEYEAKLTWAREFVEERVYELEALEGIDEATFVRVLEPLRDEVKAHGLWAAHLPPELGGQGYGSLKLGLLSEIIGRSSFGPTVFGSQAPDAGNAELIAATGTEEQKERWLYPLLDGRLRSAFSMTEPGTAGSDPTLLATRAVRDGDDWVIDGRKWFTSNGSVSDFLVVMVVTDPDAAPQGPSVDAHRPHRDTGRDHRPGSAERWRSPQGPSGASAPAATDIRRSCTSPSESLPRTCSAASGDGFRLAQLRLGPGRIQHCMRWLGQSQRAFDMLCERAVSRFAHGSYLSEKGVVQAWVADSAAEILAARLMTLYAAWKIDQFGAKDARIEISMIKYFGAQVMFNVIDRAIQVHGGLGYHNRHAARVDVPERPRREDLRRARRGSPAIGRAAPPRRL